MSYCLLDLVILGMTLYCWQIVKYVVSFFKELFCSNSVLILVLSSHY